MAEPCLNSFGSRAFQDPHLNFAHGGQADFRGRHNVLYNFLSAPGLSVNVKIQEAVFTIHDGALTVNGSFLVEAHVVARFANQRSAKASFWGSELSETNFGWQVINGTCVGRPFRFGRRGHKTCYGLKMAMAYSSATFELGNWTVTVHGMQSCKGCLIAGPEHRLDLGFSARGDAPSRDRPHGIVGQSYAAPFHARHGKKDLYPWSGHYTTSAQAEGAIEGTASEYEMQSAFATEFAFSRFNAFAAKGDHAAVGSSKTTDIVDASSIERVADPATEEERRRLSEAPCPPPSPPPVPSPPKEDPTYQSLTCATGKKKDFYIVEAWPVNAAHDPATEEGPPQMRAVALNEHRRGQTQCEEEVTVEEAQRRFARLADGELSPPVALRGLRAVHRQRLSKGLHFVCLRCPSGRTIEAVLRTELLADQQLGQLYRLGDALTVSGALEARRGRLSIRATRLSVDEPWTSLFGDIPFVHDFAAAAAAGGAGDVLLQTAISHAERVRERLDANAGVRCVAGLVRPVADGSRHMECGLLVELGEPMPALEEAVRADAALPDAVVQRIYPLSERHGTLSAACDALAGMILAASPRPTCREALPRLLERSRTSGPYDLYCCDMNAPPAVATDLLLQALPLLRAGAVVVLTFKNTFKKPAPWHEACEAALARLRGPLDGVRSVQLFANTVRECTVLGEVRAAAEAGAAERCRAMQSGRAMLLRRILADYFAEHAPDGSHKVENLVARVVGGPPTALDGVGVVGGVLWDEAELFSRLEAKYGAKVDPDP
ncbi:hypothetical protein EMIHUDRAFT_462926 [Emiliania huxleyi CCMP1516]|uniref:Uncharacterized protein n=2 Tax=Emiliania huxleyi TaxID=2903 RepID=A0A0D3K2S4_EMIH1|nr:hypothetical protein EMIHUDRAFT_462926 [Emiliania huxleyi CCMP1516]EOD30059.1 hypothetical protein EMIHUDRAFT_462926 [Emiliania huxleyi CCMP1516]|eukprot:XP_005782488.1 hypothetical protein EMIHUDRAFT_462926 [Emiliania huxleyi CCMP1516]